MSCIALSRTRTPPMTPTRQGRNSRVIVAGSAPAVHAAACKRSPELAPALTNAAHAGDGDGGHLVQLVDVGEGRRRLVHRPPRLWTQDRAAVARRRARAMDD